MENSTRKKRDRPKPVPLHVDAKWRLFITPYYGPSDISR